VKKSTLAQIFDLVSASRQKGRIFSHFAPLAQTKVAQLEKLLDKGLSQKNILQNPALHKSLREVSEELQRAHEIPAVVEAPVSEPRGRWKLYTEVVGHINVANSDHAAALKKVQRKLYKTLKSELKN